MSLILIIIIVVVVVVLLCAALSIASFSSDRFMQKYEEIDKIYSKSDLNILDFVHNLNHNVFDGNLKVVQSSAPMENFYYSKKKVVSLSKEILSSSSLASFAIVAHEMGHALQDQEGSKLKMFNTMRRVGGLIGFLFLPTLIAGIVLLFFGSSLFSVSLALLITAGAILFLAIAIKAITISVEKDASNKGLLFLEKLLLPNEISKCKELLNSARLTYWGDLFRLLLSWTLLTRKTVMFR